MSEFLGSEWITLLFSPSDILPNETEIMKIINTDFRWIYRGKSDVQSAGEEQKYEPNIPNYSQGCHRGNRTEIVALVA